MSADVVSLAAAWVRHWTDRPNDPVLVDDQGRTLVGRQVNEMTAQRASDLAASGIARGSRVLLSCAPSIDLALTYIALMRLGITVLPANTGYTERELEHLVTDARPVAAIVDDPRRLHGFDRWGLDVVVSAEVPLPHAPIRHELLDQAAADDAAFIAYTSGTTGAPKGAVLTQANLLAGATAVVHAWEWQPADRLVMALPLFHMHGLGVGLNGSLLAGSSVVVVPSFSVDAVLDAIARHAGTMFFGVPTMYARLAASDRVGELSALRLAVSGSAPLPVSVWHRLAKRSGVQVLERYGMTETVMLTSNPLHGERRPGTVGVPLPNVDVRLGEGGAVQVRGPNVFTHYLNRDRESQEAFTDDGWFITGDIGQWDDADYLQLVGRASELIITGGFNVYPRELEDVLREHPLVIDIAVVGTPDEEWGEVVTAYVVLDDSASAYSSWRDTLAAHAGERLAPYKVPRVWHRVGELPRNAMGKVVRSELTPP